MHSHAERGNESRSGLLLQPIRQRRPRHAKQPRGLGNVLSGAFERRLHHCVLNRIQADTQIDQLVHPVSGRVRRLIDPLVDLKVEVNGQSQSKQGLGDIIFGPALGFHHSEKLHSILALDLIAPTGRYDRGDLANIGRNYWDIEPVLAISYIDPAGLNIDVKTMYDFNLENPATDYRSGQELHMDYAIGWGLGNGWVVGVGGYAYRQITDDRQDGETIEDNKGRAFAIGPSVKYTSKDGWFLTAKWEQETQVRNRAEGDAYWLKLTVPF